jgi:uncharacterized protein YbbC (DUF1343 family)
MLNGLGPVLDGTVAGDVKGKRGFSSMSHIATGLDVFRDESWKQWGKRRLGLLSNQASLDSRCATAKTVIAEVLPGRLKALFGPQHGFGGEDQDNMVETRHSRDQELDLPVFSLYSELREPSLEMMGLIDGLIVDLQDVGTRVYTFPSTLLGCMKAAARSGKEIIVLDRPNPLGGLVVEGNLLKPELYSFVGPYRLPMRHGLTLGEMARLFNHVFALDCDLRVVPMKGWRRSMLWPETGLRWMMPSPNMPAPETALVYPGQVLWEGTNVSEGRGTCRPFESFGAPFLDPAGIRSRLLAEDTEGCCLQDIFFRPTVNKWQGELCRGFFIHVTDPLTFRPYRLSLALLSAILAAHGPNFRWKEPPYEYEYSRLPIDLILGDSSLREDLEGLVELNSLQASWEKELGQYLEWREPFLLYR